MRPPIFEAAKAHLKLYFRAEFLMAAITGSHFSHLAQAPIEIAVRTALAAQGRFFDNEDIARATSVVMASLSPDDLRRIAAGGDRQPFDPAPCSSSHGADQRKHLAVEHASGRQETPHVLVADVPGLETCGVEPFMRRWVGEVMAMPMAVAVVLPAAYVSMKPISARQRAGRCKLMPGSTDWIGRSIGPRFCVLAARRLRCSRARASHAKASTGYARWASRGGRSSVSRASRSGRVRMPTMWRASRGIACAFLAAVTGSAREWREMLDNFHADPTNNETWGKLDTRSWPNGTGGHGRAAGTGASATRDRRARKTG